MTLILRPAVVGRLIFLIFSLSMSIGTASAATRDWKAPDYLPGASLISAEDLKDIRNELGNIVIIDTRDSAVTNATINTAIVISGDEITPAILRDLLTDKSSPVVFFGAGEKSIKSYKAAKKAINFGYVNVFWMRGGFEEWQQKGFVTTDSKVDSGTAGERTSETTSETPDETIKSNSTTDGTIDSTTDSPTDSTTENK